MLRGSGRQANGALEKSGNCRAAACVELGLRVVSATQMMQSGIAWRQWDVQVAGLEKGSERQTSRYSATETCVANGRRVLNSHVGTANAVSCELDPYLFNNCAFCEHLFDRGSFGFRNSKFGFAASPR